MTELTLWENGIVAILIVTNIILYAWAGAWVGRTFGSWEGFICAYLHKLEIKLRKRQ